MSERRQMQKQAARKVKALIESREFTDAAKRDRQAQQAAAGAGDRPTIIVF